MSVDPSPDEPLYRKVEQTRGDGRGSSFYMVTVDEGWRQSIVCCDMYEWAADWLIDAIDGRPYAPQTRPGP